MIYNVRRRPTLAKIQTKYTQLEMWANAQRDGRPAEYRAIRLCSTPQFVYAVMLPRRETR